jgi:methionyl aminopeptidase
MLAGLFSRSKPTHPAAPILKSSAELDALRRAARVARQALEHAAAACAPGVTTAHVDSLVREHLARAHAQPLFLGYRQGNSPPFPAVTCISVNEQVVHGIPGSRVLEPSDLVSLDVGIRLDGWCADTATTVLVRGEGRENLTRAALVVAVRGLMEHARRLIRPGVRWSAVARELERAAHATGYGLVTEYVGHGIGRALHEPPRAPAYWSGFDGPDFTLEPGLVLAVEPILAEGRGPASAPPGGLPPWRMPVRLLADGWTVVTLDGSAAAHEEHMIAVTASGSVLLTDV